MKPIRIALLLAATVFTQIAAHAGEMTLFSRDNFGGREVTLRDVTPNLTDVGFNDRGSSMVVRSGTWEVCVDADFRGTCVVFERGEYPDLARFNDKISSVREVGRPGRGPDHERHERRGPRGMIELFSQRGLNGNSTRLVRERDDFAEIGFNDRADSVNVEDGVWQLCSDAQFRGTCRVFGPGRYDELGNGLTGLVSSARLVDERAPARPEPVPVPVERPQFNAPVVIFSEQGLHGRPLPIRGDTPDFAALGANDRSASILIQSGTWQFCSDSYFRGQCRILSPGEYPHLHPDLQRSISSIRQVAAANSGRDPVELYASGEFGGRRVPLRRDENSLTDLDFNDQAGSIVVNEGEWQFCVHANYGGQCVVYGPGRYPHLGPLNNQLSSVRRVR
ncbi:MAG: beta/gamma crystallin-related protein [Pseudomonadota bacterium]